MMSGVNFEHLDILIQNALVLTLDSSRRVLEPGFVGIAGRRIVYVESSPPDPTVAVKRVIDAAGGIVHPGLVDAHAHTAWGLARSAYSDELSHNRIMDEFEGPMAEGITDEQEQLGTLLACAEMALNGTTCIADTGTPMNRLDLVAEAVERVGIRGMIAYHAADAFDDFPMVNRSPRSCPERMEAGLHQFPLMDDRLVWACAGLTGLDMVTDELVGAAKDLARAHDVQLNMHKSWSRDEVAHQRARLGRDPVLALADAGVLDEATTLVHLNFCTEAEVSALTASGAAVVHCPSASMLYGQGGSVNGRFPELIRAGAPVALGTDSVQFGNSWDLNRQIYLAAALHKEVRQALPVIAIDQALTMATLHGARAVGSGRELGAIEVGRRADVVMRDARMTEYHPLLDPVRCLVLSAGNKGVKVVIVDGRVVVDKGELLTLDMQQLLTDVDRAGVQLTERLLKRVDPEGVSRRAN